MKPLLLANNSNEYPGLFSAIQHKQQNVVETVYLALSDHARLFGFTAEDIMDFWQHKAPQKYSALMNPLMILVKIIKLRWIHILSYDQMVSRKINNQTTRCANSIFYTTLFTNSAPNYT